MATHSSILTWEILWTEETDGLQFIELQNSQTWLSNSMNMNSNKHIHISPPSWASLSPTPIGLSRSSQSMEMNTQCYTAAFH